jgi:hypothetical protein
MNFGRILCVYFGRRLNTVKGYVEQQASATIDAVRSLENRLAEADQSAELDRARWRDRMSEIDADIGRRFTQAEAKIQRESEARLSDIVQV